MLLAVQRAARKILVKTKSRVVSTLASGENKSGHQRATRGWPARAVRATCRCFVRQQPTLFATTACRAGCNLNHILFIVLTANVGSNQLFYQRQAPASDGLGSRQRQTWSKRMQQPPHASMRPGPFVSPRNAITATCR